MNEESLFYNALELPVDERPAFLDRECSADARLRAHLENLLKAHDNPAGFLCGPAPGLGAPRDTRLTESPGTLIGPYKLLEQIGEGGFGIVFMAEQQQPIRRKVALKVLKPGMDTRQVIARFEAERQALALMDHPGIAKVLEAGQTLSGRPYFVMDLVRGMSITEFCDQSQLPPRERLELFVPVCEAVQHAHQKGIIHRDLKPSNVLVTIEHGTPLVKVIDFGIAKALGQQLTDKTLFTGFAQMIGTPLYMSPEQAALSNVDVDTRTDIYALGVLLYELLTGSTPLERKRLKETAFDEVLRIIREEDPPTPSMRLVELGRSRQSDGTSTPSAETSPGHARRAGPTEPTLVSIAAQRRTEPARLARLVRGELDWIVMKALEKDRRRRYESASALATDIQRYLQNEPVQAYPPSLSYRLRKFVRRHRAGVLAASLVVLALVGGMVGLAWGLMRATEAEARAVAEAKEKQESQREAMDKLWLSLYERARAGRFSRQVGQRLDSLAALEQAARIRPDERLRDEAIAAMALPDLRLLPRSFVAPSDTTALAFGPAGRLYARADRQGTIHLHRVSDDREVQRIAWARIEGRHLLFSADERFLLGLDRQSTIGVWRVADGQPVLPKTLSPCRGYAFSPDGKRLAVGRERQVLCVDLSTGEEVYRFPLPALTFTLAYSPDSQLLAVGYFAARAVSVYQAASGTLVASLPVGNLPYQNVCWHPDGQRLAVMGPARGVQLWHVASQRKLATLEGHRERVSDIAFHPDGGLLASHAWDGRLVCWDPATGRQLLGLVSVGAPQFSADGRWLRLIWEDSSKAQQLEVAPRREYRSLANSAGIQAEGYGLGDISPDGHLLAVGLNDGARVWDLATGREVLALPADTHYVQFENRRAETQARVPAAASPPWRLLTSGPQGLRRWPLWRDQANGQGLRVGSPEQLSTFSRARFGRGADGRTLVAVTEEGGANHILDLETAKARRELGSHPAGEVRALSADGQWAASCGWHSESVRLWNLATGKPVHDWQVGKRTSVFFTPDSQALIVARGEEFSFWDVKTFQLLRRMPREGSQYPGWVAFSNDGRLMALEMAPGVLHLVESASGRTVARLADPHGDRASWQAFTPDGTRLVVVAGLDSAAHVWDLRAIRTRLQAMNLDWDWPGFPSPVRP
jgi:serine/threonine protein kinase/WD40 repeat protein